MLVVLACLYYYGRLTHASERFQTVTGKGYRPRVTDLGHWRYLTSALVLGYFALVMIAPLLLVIWASLMPFYRRPAVEALATVTAKNFVTVLSYPNFADAIRNTVVLGIGTATVVMALMALTSWLSLRGKSRLRGLLDPLASLPLVFPGIVLGLATLAST